MVATRGSANGGKIRPPDGHADRVLLLDNHSADITSAIELLTVAEVAKLLKISGPSVRRLQQDRELPFIKVRGSIRITKADLAAYLEKCRVKSIDQ